MSSVRYNIVAWPNEVYDGIVLSSRFLQGGKLTANTSAISTIITVPAARKGERISVELRNTYTDRAAKTGLAQTWVAVARGGGTPNPAGAEQAVETAERFLLTGTDGTGFVISVNAGDTFAIIDAGFPV